MRAFYYVIGFPWLVICALLVTSPVFADSGIITEQFGGREVKIYLPQHLPDAGARSLVIVLHGGMGNADNILSGGHEHPLAMNKEAEEGGFIVAYLNGTAASRIMRERRKAWNGGGGCCGQPGKNAVDDVTYIKAFIEGMVSRYGVDPKHIYGTGHSNGAIMTLRVQCEQGLYAAVIAVSGPLNIPATSCPAAKGSRVMSLHGRADENVPTGGGYGTKGISGVEFRSLRETRSAFVDSGAEYHLWLVDADHNMQNIDAAVLKERGHNFAQAAARYFRLLQPKP